MLQCCPCCSPTHTSEPMMLARAEALQAALVAGRSAPAKLPRSTKVKGRFVIDPELFPDWVDHIGGGLSTLFKWRRGMRGYPSPVPPQAELERLLPVLTPSPTVLASPPTERCQATWLGHASMLTQWEGWTVLADPIFSERCSAVQWAGPKRVRPAPLQAAALPRIDVVVISHSHFDHLDYGTVRDITAAQPEVLYAVPLGMKAWFTQYCPAAAVVEFDWGDELTLDDAGPPAGAGAEAANDARVGGPRPPLELVCVPCQHWCRRTLTDTNTVLWASWIARTPRMSYYFGGDTGYCGGVFRKIAKAYGPLDLSAIPIGAEGAPPERWFHEPNHMAPDEAVACHVDLQSRQSIGIHWGTFTLTAEPIMDPPRKLAEALAERELPGASFVAMQHGEVREFDLLRRTPESEGDISRTTNV